MRKYDSKNKRNIGIIIGVCIIFAVVFSYFLIQQIRISKIKYELEASTVLFDIDKNNILLNNTGTIKKKWNNKYYLKYQDEQYNIGTHVIAFNNNELSLYLYGEFYEVNSNSEVNITKEETILNNLGITRFYKIEDRKYLIVDQNIRTEDESLQTTNYLVIELDKQGNAILYNNSLNVKVFSATKILTTLYTFDIANELLIYENETVDLKKILGTTNQYKEEENKPNQDGDGEGTGSGGGSGTGNTDAGENEGNNTGTGNVGGNNAGGNNAGNNNEQNNNNDIVTNEGGNNISSGDIINQTAYTSILKIVPHTNSIDLDYVVYDKLGKYLSVFVEVQHGSDIKVVYLSKNTTSTSITNLNIGTNYRLTFKYTYEDNELLKEGIIGTYDVNTLLPNIELVGTKVTTKKISYKITTSSYGIDSAKLRLYINGEYRNREININSSNLTGDFYLTDIYYPNNSLIELRLEDLYINGSMINKRISWSYMATSAVEPEPEPNPEPEPEPEIPPEDDSDGGGENVENE